jgi:copper homeostasis protein
MKNLLEIAAFSAEAGVIAAEAGAGRIELCSSYLEGGLTPSAGMIEEVRKRVSIPLFVMIRPRGGNFQYSEAEISLMQRDIEHCKAIGADGIVLGLLTRGGTIDESALLKLREAAGKMQVTFHRAFDFCSDAGTSLETLVRCGIHRVLTSGGKGSAMEGAENISQLNRLAAGRISIMPGGGISMANIARIAKITGCTEFHASAKAASAENVTPGFGEHVLPDPQIIHALNQML